jgi:translocation and assembly module TamB
MEAPRALLEAPLELALDVELADVAWIAALVPDLRRISGAVSGQLALRGTAQEPEFGGGLAWRGGELRLTAFDTPVRAISAEITLDEDVVVVERLYGEVGGAPVEVRGTVEPLGPFRRMDLRVEGTSLLLARSARLRLRADASLVVKGTPGQLSVAGELALTEGLYIGEISPLEELLRAGRRTRPEGPSGERTGPVQIFRDDPLASAEFDVRIVGEPFEYRTNLLRAELRPELRLRGTGGYPIVEGPVYVEEASFALPSGTMEVVSGVLQFGSGEPLRPDMTLTSEMSVARYDVRATATGTLDELEITLSSTPPLPQDDLWVLVLTGQAPTDRWQDRSSQAMESLAVFLARDTLVRWFTDGPGDGEGLLDRFEIDVGAQPSQTGQTTGRVLFYLKPRSRRATRETYLSAEIDQYDRVNYALGIVFRPR